MYHWRTSVGPVDLAFTDRHGGASAAPYDELNLAIEGGDDPATTAANLRRVADDFAPGAAVADMRQVHGTVVDVVEDRGTPDRPEADALLTGEADLLLVVRVADCLPVLLADPDAGVVGAVHAGRLGLAAGVAPAAVARMRDLGAERLTAWLGPRICGACYEVPAQMQAEVGAMVPEAVATTSWGTPSLDIGAGVGAQLAQLGVEVLDVGTCTRESTHLYSYRRDGTRAGRFAGLVRRRSHG
ncbi:MAG: peptidoglycan editing factor PgeF [Propionibacteriales bacterium]|nr:peptidoglycan editing factor PgeF [Propionibacteriales bacterium]